MSSEAWLLLVCAWKAEAHGNICCTVRREVQHLCREGNGIRANANWFPSFCGNQGFEYYWANNIEMSRIFFLWLWIFWRPALKESNNGLQCLKTLSKIFFIKLKKIAKKYCIVIPSFGVHGNNFYPSELRQGVYSLEKIPTRILF